MTLPRSFAAASICALVACAGTAPLARGQTSLTWSTPVQLEAKGSIAEVTGVSCGSSSLCVAVDSFGDAVTSIDPAAVAPTWTTTDVDGTSDITSISCVSGALCVAGDDEEGLIASADPGDVTPSWTRVGVQSKEVRAVSCSSLSFCAAATAGCTPFFCGATSQNVIISAEPAGPHADWGGDGGSAELGGKLNALSCASETLCAAVGESGNLLTTADPAGPAPWASWGGAATAISCVSASLCVAGAESGDIYVSTDPTAASPRWTGYIIDGVDTITGVSCVSSDFCVAVDDEGDVLVSSDPGTASPTWSVADLDGDVSLRSVSCASESLCAVVDDHGNVIIGKITHTVSVSLAGPGAGSVSGPGMSCPGTCSNTYAAGGSTIMTATPSAGSTFAGWGGACSGDGACQVSVSADESISADFTPSEPPSQPESQPQTQTESGPQTPTDAHLASAGPAGDTLSPRPPGVIAKFAPTFETRAALRGSTVGLLVGFPAITGAARGATVLVRCRAACSYELKVVRHATARGTVAVTLERPLVLQRATIIEIAVTKPGYLGRYVEYRFKRKAREAQPYAIDHGCLTTKGTHRACNRASL